MDKILANKLVVVAAMALIVVALGANTFMGGTMPSFGCCLRFADSGTLVAHGPTLPPEPWLRHGPTLPPEPWIKSAHGPTLPPEPWLRHGPTLPPEPWGKLTLKAEVKTPSHGPTLPPEPWKI